MRRIRIITGSRLHAGFHMINDSLYKVRYAGAGFYIAYPRIVLEAWMCEEGQAHARREYRLIINKILFKHNRNACVRLVEAPQLHYGFGVTTQLSLATYHALKLLSGEKIDKNDLVKAALFKLGRQAGSTIGSILYAYGGFTIGIGVPAPRMFQPLTLKLPRNWRFLIFIPKLEKGLSGEREKRILEEERPLSERLRFLMARGLQLLLIGVIRKSLYTTLEGLKLMQTATGQYFSSHQGGTFRRDLARIVDEAYRDGIFLAQSSWGPTLYTITTDKVAWSDSRTMRLIANLYGVDADIIISEPMNNGAIVSEG